MDKLIGLIPAAGKGLRLGLPYPKELYPIIQDNRYKPISQYILENMTIAGIEHIVIVINETKHQLIGYLGDGTRFNCHTSYVVQENREGNDQSKSPGLAHALNSAYHLVRGKTVCFGMADTIITPKDVFRLVLGSAQEKQDIILGLFPTSRSEKFGMVKLDNNFNVLQIVDKPSQSNLKFMWGCMIWRPRFTEFLRECIEEREIFDFAMVMNTALEEGLQAQGIPIKDGTYSDLGTYHEINELEKLYRAH
jgi:glucose-1-phosphate thymidylyltransferase